MWKGVLGIARKRFSVGEGRTGEEGVWEGVGSAEAVHTIS